MGLHSVGLDAGLDGSYASGSYGVLGGPGVASGGFFVSPLADDDEPDVQVTIFPRVTEPHVITQVQNSTAHLPSMLVTVALLRPEGRQRVTVGLGGRRNPEAGTTDFFGGVEVKPDGAAPGEYLTGKDVRVLSWGVEKVRGIFGMEPLNSAVGEELSPGAGVVEKDLHDFVKDNVLPNSHWVGTAKMGSKSKVGRSAASYEKDIVVDERCVRVCEERSDEQRSAHAPTDLLHHYF